MIPVVLALVLVTEPAATPRRATVVVLPFEGDRAGDLDRGYALLQEAETTLLASDRFEVFESPQRHAGLIAHQAELEAFAPDARPRALGAILGADWVLSGRLDREADRLSIVLTRTAVLESEARSRTIDARDLVEAIGLEAGVVRELFDLPPEKTARTIAPEPALLAFAGCERRLIRQPLGLRAPVALDLPLLDEAAALCEATLAADPRFTAAWSNLGLIAAIKGDRAAALRALSRAPSSEVKAIAQAILEAPRSIDQAKTTLRVAEVERSRSLWAKDVLAELSLAVGDEGLATAILTESLEAGPRQIPVLLGLAELAAKKGDHEAALEWMEKAVRLRPDDPTIALAMAHHLAESRQNEDAAILLQPWLGHPAIADRAWFLKADLALAQQKRGEAEAAFEHVLAFGPTPSRFALRGEARYRLAAIWLAEGKVELGRQALLSAAKEGYRDREALTGPLAPLVTNGFGQRLTAAVKASARPTWASLFAVDPETGRIARKNRSAASRPRL